MEYWIYKTTSPKGDIYLGKHGCSSACKFKKKGQPCKYPGSGLWIDNYKNKSELQTNILCYADSEEELDILEKIVIKASRQQNGHKVKNRTEGGDGWSSEKWKSMFQDPTFKENHLKALNNPDTKRKISLAGKGRIPANKGKPSPLRGMPSGRSPFKGKKHTPESIEKLRLSHIGKSNGPLSEERKKQISEMNKGRVFSAEARKNMSIAQKKIPRTWQIGKNLSEETKLKISASHKGKKKSEAHRINIKKSVIKRFAEGEIPWAKGKKVPEERRKRISETLKGNIPWNKGIKTGKPSWNKGIKATPEHIENLKKSHSTPEYRAKHRASRKKTKEKNQ